MIIVNEESNGPIYPTGIYTPTGICGPKATWPEFHAAKDLF